jgi:iron complex outermembrane receptor protein
MSAAMWIRLIITALVVALARSSAAAQPAAQDLKRMSIEQLMQIDVTLATRRPEPVSSAPTAISVVTGEDIRRGGVTTLADAVALAGGVHVARFNNGTWSVAARGFAAVAANKMLVMIDGRTVYSPLFTGVFWNALDYQLEDIDRIEVIRGPGATLWGANAVNGVINIVTRSSRDTQGVFAQLGAGNEDPADAEARYGGRAGAASYRVYAKYLVRNSQRFSTGASAGDGRTREQAGVRLDGGALSTGAWMLKADLFHSREDVPDRTAGEFVVGDVHAVWTRALSAQSELRVAGYLNHESRPVPLQLTHHLTPGDIDLQQSTTLTRHAIVWGGGYRLNADHTVGSLALSFDPADRRYAVANLFAQDEIPLVPQRIYLTGGLKYEHNAFSGGEWQPNIRARWLLPRQQTLWGSVARAVRRPTRFEDDLTVRLPTGDVAIVGNDDFLAETLIASEVGYRVQPALALSVDATIFNHAYDRLRSQEVPLGPSPIPLVVGNGLNGTSRGLELGINVQPLAAWRTHASYTYLNVSLRKDAASRDAGLTIEANDPRHLFQLRTSLDLPGRFEVDGRWRSVGALPHPAVPAYSEASARLGWRANKNVDVALVGDDLLHAAHAEFNPVAAGFEQFERSVRAILTTRF